MLERHDVTLGIIVPSRLHSLSGKTVTLNACVDCTFVRASAFLDFEVT
jgi:hypothetical protein